MMNRILIYVTTGAAAVLLLAGTTSGPLPGSEQATRVIDDFESYGVGMVPDQWVRVNSRDDVRPAKESLEEGERFEILEEEGNQFVRLYTKDEYIRFSQRNGKEFDWNLKEHPRLKWRWRALTLPEGASEKGENDTGGAVYVTFGTDWLGRPKSIKYTYSSTLPVGTVVSFGPLKVIVVESGREPSTGTWKTEVRHVANDYRQVFGEDPPDRPVSITISGDSNSTDTESKVDMDDITILPSHQSR
jgi:hypothetical protein